MAKMKTAKPGEARDWKAVERQARMLTSVSSVYVNDISGLVTLVTKTGATQDQIHTAFKKIVPPEALRLVPKTAIPDPLKRKQDGWRKLWPRTGR